MIQLSLNEPCLPSRQCLLLRKVLVLMAKFVHIIFFLIRPHGLVPARSTGILEHFRSFLDSTLNLEPNIHVIRK